jgi:membrane protein required for colicin V production
MSELTLVDYGLIVLVLISGVISLFRGFVKEAISLLSWIVAIWVVWTFDEVLSAALASLITDPVVRIWGARLVLFVFVLVAGGLLGTGLGLMLNKGGLTALDRLFGTVFGAARGVLLVGVLILVLEMSGFGKSPWWQGSKLIPYAAPVTAQLRKLAQGGLEYIDEVSLPAMPAEKAPEEIPAEIPEGSDA